MSPNPLDGKSRLLFFRRQGSRKSRFLARSARFGTAWPFRRGLLTDNFGFSFRSLFGIVSSRTLAAILR
jgi:hypothetical protein